MQEEELVLNLANWTQSLGGWKYPGILLKLVLQINILRNILGYTGTGQAGYIGKAVIG
jgi:hypothetical protein